MTTLELATVAAALRPMCSSDPEAVQKALTLIKQAQNALNNRFSGSPARPLPPICFQPPLKKKTRTARR